MFYIMKIYNFLNKKKSYRSNIKISSRFRFYINILIPALIVFCTLYSLSLLGELPSLEYSEKDINMVVLATLVTLSRLIMAYIFAVIVAIFLALLVEKNNFTKRFLLPIYDIAQSVPILIFFPFIILIFVKIGFTEGAAIFILFISMLWNIVFSIIGGINSLPDEVKYTAKMYNIKGLNYLTKILIPAIMPQLTVGSILAFADGWNFIIVAEVLHTYLPNRLITDDLFGIGSILVKSANQEDSVLFVYSLIAIVSLVVVLNLTVWQKLLSYAEKFKF